VFLFLAIIFFPNGLRLPQRRRFVTAAPEVLVEQDAPPAESKA
jgi:hypothetical protein